MGAALPLIAFPLAVAAYAVFVSSDHRLDRTIIVVWQDHQLAMSVLAGVGLLATLGSSLLLFSGLHRLSAAMFGLIPLAALVSLLGVGVATWTVRSSFGSPAVSPVDVPFFVLAVVGEGLAVLGAALFVSFAILVSSGAAQVALGGRPGLAGGLVSLAGAAAVAVALQRMVVLRDGINRTVHTETAAWTEFFVHENSTMGTSPVPMLALLILCVVMAGAVVLRKQAQLVLPFVVLGVSATVPAASLGLTLALVTSASRHVVPVPLTRSLEPLRGRVTSGASWRLGSTGITSAADFRGPVGSEVIERELARRHFQPPAIAVERGSRTDDLVSFLEAARRAGVQEVGLVGQSEVDLTGTASELRPLLEQIQSSARQVDLKLVGPEAEQRAQFVLTRTTSLEALLRSAEVTTARFEPLVVLLRP